MKRFIIAWLALGTPALTATPTIDTVSLAPFEAARARADVPAMARLYNARLLARFEAHTRDVDATLDVMFGELAIELGEAGRALPYVMRAAKAATDRGQAERLFLAAARAYAGNDDLARADAMFADLENSGDESIRAAAGAQLAGTLLYTDPAAAAARLSALAGTLTKPSSRWEVDLLLSRAFSLNGDQNAARESLDRAWREAPEAADPAIATQRTAGDLALTGGRNRAIGLALVAKAQVGTVDQSALPPCGPKLRPDDTLVVEAVRTKSGFEILPVRASRPGVAAAFYAMDQVPLAPSDGPIATAELRCRLHPNEIASAPATTPTALADWMAASGGYGPMILGVDGIRASVADAEEALDRAQAAYGAEAAALAPLLVQAATTNLAVANAEHNSGYLERAQSAADRLLAVLRAHNAPAPVIAEAVLQRARMIIIRDTARERSLAAATWLDAILANAVTTPAIVAEALKRTASVPAADHLVSIDKVIAFYRARGLQTGGPWFRNALVSRADALRELDRPAEAIAAMRASGADPTLCAVAETPPSFVNLDAFSADNYPADLVMAALESRVTIEFDIDRAGNAKARLLASSPPRLFDEATLAGAANTRFSPALHRGRPIACGGFSRVVRWQLPKDGDDDTAAPHSGPTS